METFELKRIYIVWKQKFNGDPHMSFITRNKDMAITHIEDGSKEIFEIDKDDLYSSNEIKYILYDKKHCSWYIEETLIDTPL